MKTYVYIDGFNLYFGALINGPNKWLNLMAMCKGILGEKYDIVKIKYFTARVRSNKNDPQVTTRQDAYLRALEAYIPEIEIKFGHFSQRIKRMPLANPTVKGTYVKVHKNEEKGSDVNLAIHFLNDAWFDNYECGVIVSNDSDLAEAVRIVKKQRKKRVIIVNPHTEKQESKHLKRYAHNTKTLDKTQLSAYHLPNPIPGTTIHKPHQW